jgi:hypothetical protein
MNFVENTKIGVNEQKYFHSNLSEWGDMFNYLMIICVHSRFYNLPYSCEETNLFMI